MSVHIIIIIILKNEINENVNNCLINLNNNNLY